MVDGAIVDTPPVRTPFGLTNHHADGSLTTRLSPRQVHWQDESTGQLKPFDNTVRSISPNRALTGFTHENTNNAFRATFATQSQATSGGTLARVAVADHAVGMAAVGAHPGSVTTAGGTVTYTDAWQGVDVRYTVDGDRLKEDVIIRDAAGLAALIPAGSAQPVLTFDLTLEGLAATYKANGRVIFADVSGAERFVMPRPFMLDSSNGRGRRSNDIGVTLTQTGTGTTRLELRPDAAWLLNPARVYPVVIDPTLITSTVRPAEAAAKDTYISQLSPSSHFEDDVDLVIGKMSGNAFQTLVQFDELQDLPQDSIITSAKLWLYNNGSGNGSAFTVEAHRITGGWEENTATWNAPPAMDATIEASATAPVSASWMSLDVTSLVRRWVPGEVTNYGVRLAGTGGDNDYQAFWSSSYTTDTSKRPYLEIKYTVATRYGIDRRHTYTESGHGGGNTSKVNTSTGNLVFQHSNGSIPARGFTVDLVHTYNSQNHYAADLDNIVGGRVFGDGWTFSYNLRLAEFDSANGVRLKDGSGQWRVYYKESDSGNTRSYRRPVYYDHTLTKDLTVPPVDASKVFTLTLEKGLTKYFFAADGALRRIEDRNGNYLIFAYDGSSRLTTITDVASRTTTLAYSGPGSPARLSQTTDMAGRVTTFGYATSTDNPPTSVRLTSITNAYGTTDAVTTTMTYDDSGQLTGIINPRGHTSPIVNAAEGTWETTGNTDGWARRTDCGGATTSINQSTAQHFMGAGALEVVLNNMTCGGVIKTLPVTAPMSATRQQLVGYVYVPSGVSAGATITAAFNVKNSEGIQVQGPNFAMARGAWNRIWWVEAPVDPAKQVQNFGVQLVASGATYTGSIWLDQVFLRGVTAEQQDASDSHVTVAKYTYDPANLKTTVQRPDQGGTLRSTVYTHNGLGRTTQVTDPLNNSATYNYDGFGRVTTTTPPPPAVGTNRDTTTSYYAGTNYAETVSVPIDASTTAVSRTGVDTATGDTRYVIDPNQEYARTQDQAFTATVFQRDSNGNVTGERVKAYAAATSLSTIMSTNPSAPFLRTTDSTYHASSGGLVATTTDPNGHVTSYEYDGGARNKGYLTQVTHPALPNYSNRVTTYVRNADGSVQQQTDPTGRVTTYEYDNLGRLKQTNFGVVSGTPLFSVSQTYDANSNVITVTDGNGRVTTSAYDANNRLTSVTQPAVGTPPQSPVATSAYYANGLLHTRTDPNGRVTTFTYDSRNLLSTQTEPGNFTTTFTYDARGNRRTRTDARTITTTSTYDLRGQLTALDYSDATPDASFVYDRSGNRTSMAGGGGGTYSYDSLNRLTAFETAGSPYTCLFTYQYDPAGNLTAVAYPNCPNSGGALHSTTYTYLAGGLLGSVSSFAFPSGTTAAYTYDAAGRETHLAYPNGTRALRAYDAAGRLTVVENRRADNAVITAHAYTLDGAGNTTSAAEHIGTTSYGYDALDRLTTVVYPGLQGSSFRWGSYEYNAGGDRLLWQRWKGPSCDDETNGCSWLLDGEDAYGYDSGGRMTTAAGIGFTYDSDGNQTGAAGNANIYAYDAERRLTATGIAPGPTTATTYDPDGGRTWTWAHDAEGLDYYTSFRLDAGNGGRLAVQDVFNGSRTFLVYGAGGRLLAQQLEGSYSSTTTYYHVDGIGNTRAMSGASGQPTGDSQDYGPFGELRSVSGMMEVAGQYQGAPSAGAAGLTYLGGRQYNALVGRFTTKGPGGQGYVYAANNPIARPTATGPVRGLGVSARAAVPPGDFTATDGSGAPDFRSSPNPCNKGANDCLPVDGPLPPIPPLPPVVIEGIIKAAIASAYQTRDFMTKTHREIILQLAGTLDDAQQLFNKLANTNTLRQDPNGVLAEIWHSLAGRVMIRTSSSQGPPTVDIMHYFLDEATGLPVYYKLRFNAPPPPPPQ